MGWDKTPFVAAFFEAAHPRLQEQEPESLRAFIWLGLIEHGAKRPIPWGEFVARLAADPTRHPAFVYDRRTQLVFVGGFAWHERAAALIYATRASESIGDDWEDLFLRVIDDNRMEFSDRYIAEGMGFMQNSMDAKTGTRRLILGKDVRLTARERSVFSGYEFDRGAGA